jgi:ABC-type multidrug transport system fused ATPase/permease subunit
MTTRRGLTLQDVRRPVERRPLSQLPRLLLSAARLLWSAAPRELAGTSGLQMLAGAATGAQIVLARNLLDAILANGGGDADVVPVLAALGALGIVALITAFAGAVQVELQRLMAELVSRRVATRVFDVAASAELERFDDPEFHDRLQRAWTNGLSRPLEMTQSVSALVGAAASLVGIAAGLAATLPLLVPLLLLGAFPVLRLTTRSSRDLHAFSWGVTALDRRRAYLSRVVTHRQYAHEVIAFSLSRFLSERWQALQDERLHQLHGLVRRRIARAAIASLGLALIVIVQA